MPLDYFINALVTLAVTVDPVGLVPAFLAVTHGVPAPARHSVSVRACFIAASILTGTALVGDWLLGRLGISLPAFRIAGGLLLLWVAYEMVFGVRIERQSKQAEEAMEERVRNVAAFPLAIPLMAGPGAITATLLLSAQTQGRPLTLAFLIAAVVIVVGGCFAAFVLAAQIGRVLGITGNIVSSRLLGVVLAALAVQFMIDGVRSAIAG
ncbi:MAG: MarC family protein [Hyphomicrobiales bacterium]|nr:MarC family protein [Hyphomicrobiales bacterium]